MFAIGPSTLAQGQTLVRQAGGNTTLALMLLVLTNTIAVFIAPFLIKAMLASQADGIQLDSARLLINLVITVLAPSIVGKASHPVLLMSLCIQALLHSHGRRDNYAFCESCLRKPECAPPLIPDGRSCGVVMYLSLVSLCSTAGCTFRLEKCPKKKCHPNLLMQLHRHAKRKSLKGLKRVTDRGCSCITACSNVLCNLGQESLLMCVPVLRRSSGSSSPHWPGGCPTTG